MKTQNIRFIILSLFAVIFTLSLWAQSPEQVVRDAENSINQKIDQVHKLAIQRDIKGAFKKLDQINKEINKEFTWRTFDEKYREAKRSNPNFSFQIREDLPEQLSLSFWTDYVARCDKIMSDQDIITEGMISMVQLNRWDQAMAYGAQLKTMYETFTGAAENLGSANLLKFAYDLHGNMNDFVENYKKIEKAELEGIEIETFQVDFNRMTSKARKSKRLYNEYIESIRKNQGMIVDFEYNIKNIKKLKKAASIGPLFPLSYADRKYNWDYEDYQNNVEEICGEFEDYEIKCSDFKKDYSDIKSQARSNWNSTKGNIYASDDEAHKQEFLNHHTERWAEFLRQVQPIYENTYQIYCVDNSAPDTPNSDNPFDGATAGGSAQTGDQSVDNKNANSEKFKISNIQITEEYTSGLDYVATIRVKFDFFHDGYCYITTNVFVDGKKSTNQLFGTGLTSSKTDPISINVTSKDALWDGKHKIKIEIEIKGHETISENLIIIIKDKTIIQTKSSSSNNTKPKVENQANNSNSGSTSQNESSGRTGNNNSGATGGNYKPPTPPKTNANSQTNIPSNAFLIGSISNSGNKQGVYKSVELKKLMTYDKIVFKLISGQLEYVQLIWRKEGGIWETEYQGNKTDFNISKGLKNIPSRTTHLNFVVNAHHNRWSSSDKACKMEVYLIPRTGGGSSSNSFYDLIDQANVAFNVNYWEEEQGTTSSSNPKQKSLDLLRKAERMINREPNFNTQLEMVELLVSTSTDYAKRVHAYIAKVPFMELAGRRLHKTSTSIPSASKSASTYSKIASMWRTLTRAAIWGDHAFNKMYCDEQAKKYASLAGE